MLKLTKKKQTYCFRCENYYDNLVCSTCTVKAYNVYNRSILTRHVISRLIPAQFYGKIILLLTQIQPVYSELYVEQYILKLLNILQDEKTIMVMLSLLTLLL